eukprot:39903-Pleurochrysis_carterae.AAC.1
MEKRRKYLEQLSLKGIPQHHRRFNEARKHRLRHLEWIHRTTSPRPPTPTPTQLLQQLRTFTSLSPHPPL